MNDGWFPRPSKLGSFVLCDYRAALEYLAATGQAEDPAVAEAFQASATRRSPHADFGTCVHYLVMRALMAEFQSRGDESSLPWESAAGLFGHDLDVTMAQARKVAALAVGHFPANIRWKCEIPVSGRGISGTIDFLSDDGTYIADLKTTSKPIGDYARYEHLVQLLVYWDLSQRTAKTGAIIYVSVDAESARRFTFDLTDRKYADLADSFVRYIREYLMDPEFLLDRAIPRVGQHCYELWCPFQDICKNDLLRSSRPKTVAFQALDKMPDIARL